VYIVFFTRVNGFFQYYYLGYTVGALTYRFGSGSFYGIFIMFKGNGQRIYFNHREYLSIIQKLFNRSFKAIPHSDRLTALRGVALIKDWYKKRGISDSGCMRTNHRKKFAALLPAFIPEAKAK
jgi:hypothetical protein